MSLSHCTSKREHLGIMKGSKFKIDTGKYFPKLCVKDNFEPKFKVRLDFIQMIKLSIAKTVNMLGFFLMNHNDLKIALYFRHCT